MMGLMGPCIVAQMVVMWVENGGTPRNVVPLLEDGSGIPDWAAGGPWRSDESTASGERTVEMCVLAEDTTDSKIVAKGTVEEKGFERIGMLGLAEQDTDMLGPERCAGVQLTGATHTAEGYDGLVHTAVRYRYASSSGLVGGVGRESG